MTTTIGIHLFPDVEELDFAGPWEVLAYWSRTWPDDDVRVLTFARDEGPVTCAKGLRVIPDETWETCPPLEVLIYPGGRGTRAHLGDEAHRTLVREHAAAGTLMTSVCTGALVYADAGLLDGRPATTYHSAMDLLVSLGQDIEARPEDRFVDDGDVVTAAGVSAGIDMALHLVARLHSVERAREVRRGIEYDPAPPI